MFSGNSTIHAPSLSACIAFGATVRSIFAPGWASATRRPFGPGTSAAGRGFAARSGPDGSRAPCTSPSRMQSNPTGLATCIHEPSEATVSFEPSAYTISSCAIIRGKSRHGAMLKFHVAMERTSYQPCPTSTLMEFSPARSASATS